VKKTLAAGIDWRKKGAVTAAKDQGARSYCGTFGRTAAAEGQVSALTLTPKCFNRCT